MNRQKKHDSQESSQESLLDMSKDYFKTINNLQNEETTRLRGTIAKMSEKLHKLKRYSSKEQTNFGSMHPSYEFKERSDIGTWVFKDNTRDSKEGMQVVD